MRASAVAGVTAVLALAGGLVPTGAHAIIGGVEAGKLRGAVQVNGSHGYTCSGIMVAEDWVLTAKHCLAGETYQTMSVYVGNRALGQGTYRGLRGFTRWSLGDAALLQLDEEIPGAAFPMAPPVNRYPAIGTSLAASGWGVTENGTLAPRLKVCTVKMSDVGTDGNGITHFILSRVDGIQSNGDSGGPVTDRAGVTWAMDLGTSSSHPGMEAALSLADEEVQEWMLDKMTD